MRPEEKARQEIDILLEQAGWVVQDYDEVNLQASLGVAVGSFLLKAELLIICFLQMESRWQLLKQSLREQR
jgi:hypothetical protein